MAERPLQVRVAKFDRSGRMSVKGRLDPFAAPFDYDRHLREADLKRNRALSALG
jgi:hypothetical protein